MALLTPEELNEKLSRVKLLLLDVDGILTTGTLFFIEGQGWTRTYNVYDGYGIRLIQRLGIKVGVISGGHSTELKERMKVLGIDNAILGSEDKFASLNQIIEDTGVKPEEMCYMGDELFDIPALKKVGLAITVPNACAEVKKVVHHVTTKKGGEGAVREIIDAIRYAQHLGFELHGDEHPAR